MGVVPASVDTSNAALPAAYEQAKKALAECASVDECQTWADKAAALASYARQAEDGTLLAHAQRIQARAIRRASALLKQIDRPSQGGRPKKNGEGDHPVSYKQAATDAGMSEHQRKQTMRVGNVPDDEFERLVESDSPPTLSQLADIGKQKQPPKQQFAAATHAVGALRRFVKEAEKYDPQTVAAGLMESEVAEAAMLVRQADAWLDTFIVTLESKPND